MRNETGLRAITQRHILAGVLAISLAQLIACESSGDPIDFENPELLEEEDGEPGNDGGQPSDIHSDGGSSASEGRAPTNLLLVE